jgi:hypothetical protein
LNASCERFGGRKRRAAKAKIAFDAHGEKILILKYAKIRVVEVDK